MKKLLQSMSSVLLTLCFLITPSSVFAADSSGGGVVSDVYGEAVTATAEALQLDCISAILMEEKTGAVLYESNADAALPPASVTKIMTLLIVMEAIDSGKIAMSDLVTASAHAASMGGSQIYLKEGEQMTVEDLLKSVVISSANDAALALAEYVAGSEEAFVALMNQRAKELGANTAHFENTNGLDDTVENHVLSARDIAILSRALIAHKEILKYSSIWMDTIRNGAFGLTNTNRLVRFYPGCTGLKTGSTSKAKFCVSVTAERDGLSLICVIMGSSSRDTRNASAQKLLDWGFANFALAEIPAAVLEPIRVTGGIENFCPIGYDVFYAVVPKAEKSSVRFECSLPDTLAAPVKKGEAVGEIVYYNGERELGKNEIKAQKEIGKITFLEVLRRVFGVFVLK